MLKVMKISGNFKQFGEWSEPDPGFSGLIVVEDDGSFVGYQNELYGPVAGIEALHNDRNLIRFIAGYVAKSGDGSTDGIAFYKLSMDGNQSPLMYFVPDLSKEGSWATLGAFGMFEPQGEAKVALEDVEVDGEIEKKIKEIRLLHKSVRGRKGSVNDQLLDQVDSCLLMLRRVG